MAERAHPHDPAFQDTIYEQRLRERYAACLPWIAGKDVLDVPCGTGWGTSTLTGAASLTGVDIDAAAIAFAEENYPGIRFLQGSMGELPFSGPPQFDVVICLEGLEHVHLGEARAFLAEVRRVLRPDGRLIVTAPLLRNGKHSGNPYHLYEFTDAELRELLARHFREVSFELFGGPDGPEARFVGARRDSREETSSGEALEQATPPVYERLYGWLMAQRTETGFRFSAGGEQTLIATSCGILLLESLDHLDRLPAERKELWRQHLQSCQDAATGLFRDPLLDQFPIDNGDHDADYLSLQMTYFALHALDALGATPQTSLAFLDRLGTPAALSRWFQERNWSNPWLEGNRVMFVLSVLIYQAEEEGSELAPRLFHHALDWLDHAQDPQTGLWGTRQGASLHNALAGAYHFVPFYEYVNRPLRHIHRIIDSALRLQRSDALFAPEPGGGACEDLDAIDLLATFTRQSSYRADEVKKALVRSFWAIWNLQNEDGGFPYARIPEPITYRFSGWRAMEVEKRASDVWSGWFRGLALATIGATYPEDLPRLGTWRFRRRPALGYHRHGPELSDHERSVLPIWIRQSAVQPVHSRLSAAPAVTVVIPCYNLGRFLHEALESVLAQTYRDFEIIIVDDGSTDEFTVRLLAGLERPNTRVLRQENLGVAAARNAAIARSRGRYICCLDADDLYDPAFLEKAVAVLDADSTIGFVSTYYKTFDGYEEVMSFPSCDLPEILVKNCAMVSALFRKAAWSEVGGYCESLTGLQDWDFWISILERGYRSVILPEVLFHYRIRPDSMLANTRLPENYHRLIGQIAERHAETFARHATEIAAGQAEEFSRLLQVRQQEQLAALRAEEAGGRKLAERDDLIAKLEAGKAWLERQFFNWQAVAEDRGREITALQEQVSTAQANATALAAALEQERSRTTALAAALEGERSRTASLAAALEQQGSRTATLAAELKQERWRMDALKAVLEERRSRLAARDLRSTALQADLAEREETIAKLLASTSWKVTAPMRAVGRFLRRMRQPGGTLFGTAVWRVARFAYRLLPISGRARHKLRGTMLAWLSVPAESPPDMAVARLRDLVQGLTWRRAAAAAALLLRGDVTSLKMHVNQFVRHAANEEIHAALTEPAAELLPRRQEPWPAARPLVSVIIPCYNYGQFIAEAVDFVLAQTFQNLEILVVDGGSSAETLDVLKNLERPKTQVYLREGRHLVGDNRNFGISRAQGKYVCCIDADDMIKPTYLEKALFLLETQDYDVVSTSIQCFGGSREIFHVERFPVLADMLKGNHVNTCAVYRKDLWARAGGYEDTGVGLEYVYEDWRLWIRFAALGARIANIVEEPLFLYRVHSTSLSRQKEMLSMEQQREAVIELNQDVLNDGAFRRSEENRSIQVKMENGLVNLKSGWDSAVAGTTTILIAMPFLVIGGAERLISEVAAYLHTCGFRIIVVTTEYVYPVYGDSTPWFERTTPEIYHLPRFLQPNRWREFIFYLLETRNVSLLWIVGSRVFYELLPELKSAYPDLRVIDLLFNTVGHTASNRKYAEYFDKILVENREVATWLLAAGEPPERVLQIPSGIDLEAFRPRPKSTCILGELGIPAGSFIAGFSGRLSEEKDPDTFLEIACLCRRDPRLVFLMTGAGPLTDQVRKRIEKMALGEGFHFLGQVEHVRDYMSSYDVLVLPSRLDGRPVAVLESLAFGVPVIASRVGALPELVQDGVTGFLCEPGDADAFAERIRWLAAHPEEHRRMKAAARAFAEVALDAREMFERYEEAIRGVLAQATPVVSEEQGHAAAGLPDEELGDAFGRDLDPQPRQTS